MVNSERIVMQLKDFGGIQDWDIERSEASLLEEILSPNYGYYDVEVILPQVGRSRTDEEEQDQDITWPEYIDSQDQPTSNELLRVIEESRHLLELGDDWDGEGGLGYAEETWSRAIRFLTDNVLRLQHLTQQSVIIPFIDPGPYGSIDIHWRTDKCELLINVPQESDKPLGFYGDNFGSSSIKGKLDTSENNEWIMLWLMK